jgi:HTH-type transcriptional regulator/antitoxin HigA
MLNQQAKSVLAVWPSVSPFVYVPHTEQEYEQLVTFLDGLIDEVGEDESHPLASLMDVVGTLIEKYEDEHVPELSLDV